MTVLLSACSSAQKLIDIKTDDGGKAVVKKGFFSGIDYIYVEKKWKGKLQYKLFYDCECGVAKKISLRKDYIEPNGQTSVWVAVTDTTDQTIFFDETISEDRLNIPTQFMAITEEEINLIEIGINKVDKLCCRNPNKPIRKVFGYVRVR